MIESIIHLGRVLGLAAVAEGVEQEGQATALEALDCDYGQGHLFARPMDPDDVMAFLADAPTATRPANAPVEAGAVATGPGPSPGPGLAEGEHG